MRDADAKPSGDPEDIVAFLRPGGRVVVLVGPLASDKSELMNVVLSALPGRALRVANPLVSPLTTDRVLLQINGESIADDNSDAIIRCVIAQLTGSEPATFVIDDAQTLDAEMLVLLARLPGLKGEGGFALNVMVAANSEWLRALPDDFGTDWRDPEHTMVVTLTSKEAFTLPETPPSTTVALSAAPRTRSWHGVGVITACAVILLLFAGAFILRPGTSNEIYRLPIGPVETGPMPTSAASPSVDLPTPAAVTPTAKPEALTSEQDPLKLPLDVVRSETQDSQLRAEFSAFLDRSGNDTASLIPGAKEALFREYLDWRARSRLEPPRLDQPVSPN